MSVIDWNILYIPDPIKGRPLFGGKIFVGEPDLDPEIVINQKQLSIIQEDGTVVAVPQPFILSTGGVPFYNGSPVRLDVDGNYSIKVLDKNDSQTYYIENVFDGQPVTIEDLPDLIDTLLINDLSQAYEFKTLNDAVISTINFPAGKALNIKERTTGNGGGAIWDVSYTVIPNGSDIIASTGMPGLSLVLRVGCEVVFSQFGVIGDGITINTTLMQAAFDFANTNGLPIKMGSGVFASGAISITTANPFTLKGNSRQASQLLFSGTSGVTVIQSSFDHYIAMEGFAIKTSSDGVGTGLTIDGRPQVSANSIQERSTQRGSFNDLFIGGVDKETSFLNGFDFISFGWFKMNNIGTRGTKPVNQTTTAATGTGILIRGNGSPVEIFISNWWGYFHGDCLRTPDSVEGLFIDSFNLVSVTNGLTMGVTDADTLGVLTPSTLGFTISNGHINGRGRHIDFGELSNQNKVDNILLYVKEGTYTTGDTTALRVGPGGNNNVSDVSFIVLDDLVSRTSLTPLTLIGQNNSLMSSITTTAGPSTQIAHICDASFSSKCGFSGFSVNASSGSVGSYFKTESTTQQCTFSAVLSDVLTVGMVDNNDSSITSAATQNTYNITYSFTSILPVVGGLASEVISITLPSWLLSRKTTDVQVTASSMLGGQPFIVTYDELTSTDAQIDVIISTNNGSNLVAGVIRMNFKVRP